MQERLVLKYCEYLNYLDCKYYTDIFGNNRECSSTFCPLKSEHKRHLEEIRNIYKEMEK